MAGNKPTLREEIVELKLKVNALVYGAVILATFIFGEAIFIAFRFGITGGAHV